MSWKATLDGNQVKQLKAALVCFSKIGEGTTPRSYDKYA